MLCKRLTDLLEIWFLTVGIEMTLRTGSSTLRKHSQEGGCSLNKCLSTSSLARTGPGPGDRDASKSGTDSWPPWSLHSIEAGRERDDTQ